MTFYIIQESVGCKQQKSLLTCLNYKRRVAFVRVKEKVSARGRMATPVGLFSAPLTIPAALETWVSPLTSEVLGGGMWWVRLG